MSVAAYEIDGVTVVQEAFYAVACDPSRPVVVEACAGAGKTWMLVSRIVRALLDGAQPQQILAITFTRKAAGEMRQRLDDWLADWARPELTHEQRVDALRQRGMSAASAQAAAPRLAQLQQGLHQGGRAVEVRTFHAWFAQLARHAPIELLQRLALPSPMQLIEDTSTLYRELFHRFHTVLLREPALREDYLALVRRHRRTLVQQWLEAALQRSAELLSADAAGTLAGAVPAAASVFPGCADVDDPHALMQREPLRGELARLVKALVHKAGAKAVEAAEKLLRAIDARTTAEAAFELAWNALFTDKGTPRKLGQVDGLELAIAALESLRAMLLQHHGHLDHQRMHRLSRVLLAEFAALKRQQGLVDMTDLERAALAMLCDPHLSPWLQERLDAQLRHVLIDEFQDTSPLQWQALHGWLSAYAGAGGGASGQAAPTLFIVGDPKQSIYRFRRAEPRVFDAAKHFVSVGMAGHVLACDHTRRNAPAIIDALNPVFEQAMAQDAWLTYRRHTSASTEAGQVQRLPEAPREPRRQTAQTAQIWRPSLTHAKTELEERLRLQEARHVAVEVAALVAQQHARAGEVMVLARKRAVLADVALALAALGVPCVVPESSSVTDAPESLDLIALLDVLASPGHDLSLARALKSPLFGCSDDDLLWLSALASEQALSWRSALLTAAHVPAAALVRAQALLRGWCAAAHLITPHDLLDRIAHEGDVMSRLLTTVPAPRRASAVDAVNAVIAAAIDQRGGRFATLYGFVRELKRGTAKITSPAPADAVQLLTVHGAKGLEAKVVFVVDSDPEVRRSNSATVLVDWPVECAAPRRVAFVAHESRLPPSLRPLLDQEQQAREREELNALYVAMTRARERLVFSRTEPHVAAARRSWWHRVHAHASATLTSHDAIVLPTVATEATVPVPRLPLLTNKARGAAIELPRDAASARVGQALHRWLEWAAPRIEHLARGAEWAAAAAASQGLGAAAAADILAAGRAVLTGPACRRFFDPSGLRWAGNEVALAWQGRVLRIDRLVQLDEGGQIQWWVLDYKMHAAPTAVEAYRAQLVQYVQAVQALLPGEVVRGAFITAGGALQTLRQI